MCVWYLSCLSSASRVGFCWTLSGVCWHVCSCSTRKRWISCKISLKHTHTQLQTLIQKHNIIIDMSTESTVWACAGVCACVPVLVLQLHDQLSLLFVGVIVEVCRSLWFRRATQIRHHYNSVYLNMTGHPCCVCFSVSQLCFQRPWTDELRIERWVCVLHPFCWDCPTCCTHAEKILTCLKDNKKPRLIVM